MKTFLSGKGIAKSICELVTTANRADFAVAYWGLGPAKFWGLIGSHLMYVSFAIFEVEHAIQMRWKSY
jgi:hypothetical protein